MSAVLQEYILHNYKKLNRREIAERMGVTIRMIGIQFHKMQVKSPEILQYEGEIIMELAGKGYTRDRIRVETGIGLETINKFYPKKYGENSQNLEKMDNNSEKIHNFIKLKCKECGSKVIGVTVSCIDDLLALDKLEGSKKIKKKLLESGVIKIELIGG